MIMTRRTNKLTRNIVYQGCFDIPKTHGSLIKKCLTMIFLHLQKKGDAQQCGSPEGMSYAPRYLIIYYDTSIV
jgi:hypothetical protein